MNNVIQEQLLFAKAIADETRQEIMNHLCCEWLSVNAIVELMNGKVNQPTVSHHLKLLAEAKLVHVRKDGKYRYYSLNQEQVTTCCGRLVEKFAPDFTLNLIAPDEIK
jgi:ArsR family transcriptional regulator